MLATLPDWLRDILAVTIAAILAGLAVWIRTAIPKAIANALAAVLKARRPGELAAKVEETAWNDAEIIIHLGAMRSKLPTAQRAYLSRYHNGDHFVDDASLLKKTRTHEVVKEGYAYQAERFRGILISTLTHETTLVMQPGPSFTAVGDLPGGMFKMLMQQGGAKGVARCGVYKMIDGHKRLVGFIGVDFDSDQKPADIALICECAKQIEQYI